jgi:hypothetical protein
MFKLLPKVDKGEILTITHKNHKYVILPEEKARKLRLIEGLNNIPKIDVSRDEIRNAMESGRK